MLNRKQCRICGNEGRDFFSRGGYSWCRCHQCFSITKILTEDEYWRISPSYDPGHYLTGVGIHAISKALDVTTKQAFLSDLASSVRSGGNIVSFLDIGCGMGAYLLAGRNLGFNVLGFEPSDDHARVATQELGLPVIGGYFSPEKLDGRKFDIVMLSHVIEHIYDPGLFLRGILEVLAKNGKLIVITPNSQSLSALLSGKFWTMLKPVDHVSMISSETFRFFSIPAAAAIQREVLFDDGGTHGHAGDGCCVVQRVI